MGQTLSCCGCCWSFCCEIHGCSYSLFCCSCWMCGDHHLLVERGLDCCKCGGCDHGYGYSCFLNGHYMCVPDWLKRYSVRKYIGDYLGPLGGDIQVTPFVNFSPPSAQGFGQVQMIGVQQPNYNPYPYQA